MFHAASSLAPSPRPSQNQNDRQDRSGDDPGRPADRPAGRPSAPPAAKRDAFFDNAKYLAIVLVAMGHAWEPLKGDSRVLTAAYVLLYTFHMPAFIVISGYFSRGFDASPGKLKRLVTGVVVPYVVFETAYPLLKTYVGGAPQDISLLDPYYLTWFLCALFIWRLTTPLWKLVRHPVPLALGIAMLASATPGIGGDLDLPRVLQFLPFFVLGLNLRPEHFALVRRRAARIAAVPVFAFALVFAWWAVPRMNSGWLYHRNSAQELGVPWWVGPVMQLALFGCSLLLTACFLSWVPGRATWFTTLGAGTLYGYLTHGLLLKTADYRGWFDHPALHRPLGEIAVTVAAAAAVTALCTSPVRRVLRCVVEPRMEWAFKRDAAELARGREREKEKEKDAQRQDPGTKDARTRSADPAG
ncbi:acyltransferase family protein [Streptomyces sp. MBT97]|uniref:acyltransferase family protein n=1 Tax=Streptomyces sp. MBT97 TaxID=2800411 RepID=UPI00190CCEC7|nr:acyltransferase family protein [Streptomyces sp. MBT97]MBK3636051.1 acyltransferase family protein [Streptomyces sp. MBT97]